MASTSDRRDEELEGVEFIMEDDGRITARDTETGIVLRRVKSRDTSDACRSA